MTDRTRALYADLATALGVAPFVPDDNGGIQLTIGEDTNVALYAEGDRDILLIAPLAPLPAEPEYGIMLWLLRKNLYTSGLAPFVVACDDGGTLVLWGRMPLDGLTGARLASLVDAVAAEARRIQAEVSP